MNYIKIFVLSFLVMYVSFPLLADESANPVPSEKEIQTILSRADSAYLKGEFKEAISLYTELSKVGDASSSLLYNLGNAAYRNGDFGIAVLSYRKALRLAPGDKTILNNLDVVRNKVEDANRAELKGKKTLVGPDDLSFFESFRKIIAEDVSSNYWAGWAAACFVLAIVCAAAYIFSSIVIVRKGGFFGGFVLLGLSVLFLIFSFMAATSFRSIDKGVIMEYKVELLSEPDADAKKVGTPLTRGTELTIIETEMLEDNSPKWYKVRLNHNFIGWLPASAIAII